MIRNDNTNCVVISYHFDRMEELGESRPVGIGDGAVWVNQGTAAMAAATPDTKDAICPWRYIRKASDRQRPMILMVCSDIPARCKVMAPPERRE